MATDKTMVRKLKLAEAQIRSSFARLQEIFDFSKKISDANAYLFITKAKKVPEIRKDYANALNESEAIKIETDEDYIPNFDRLKAFDEMADQIENVHDRLVAKLDNVKAPSTSSQEAPVASTSFKIKLEPIQIIDFDGSPENWIPFYQLFSKLIHENKDLSNLQKVNYLVKHLKGSAKCIVTGIPPTAENYQQLFDTLVSRFNDERALGNYYLDKMMNFRLLTQESEKNLNLFLENFVEAANAIRKLNINDVFDFFLVYLAGKKLDPETFRLFDMTHRNEAIPEFSSLVTFVREQTKILARNKRAVVSAPAKLSNSGKNAHHVLVAQSIDSPRSYNNKFDKAAKNCLVCKNGSHQLYKCPSFLGFTPRKRFEFIKNNKFCFNCLSDLHISSKCKSTHVCSRCNRRHHSLLHYLNSQPAANSGQNLSNSHFTNQGNSASNVPDSLPVTATSATSFDLYPTMVLLSTAQVAVKDSHGKPIILRALLDPGSQSHFIRKDTCERLGIQTQPIRSLVKFLGRGIAPIREQVTISFSSLSQPQNSFSLNALVMEDLTDKMPSVPVNISNFTHLSGLELADKNFHTPGSVDLLIGASLWPVIVGSRKIEGPANTPTALESVLGWLLMGTVPVETQIDNSQSCHAMVEDPVNSLLEKFWQLEEIPSKRKLEPADEECERHFLQTVRRHSDGRFMVSLPFRLPPDLLGDSLQSATRKFLSLERRLSKFPELKQQYSSVMENQISNGYMSLVSQKELDSTPIAYYLPHHGVMKPDSSSTPLRIVLNASSPTTSKYSLNDLLHVGPKLQTDLVQILLNFRLFAFVLTSDVRQMYLRIEVNPADRCFQRLIWRFSPQEELKIYQMNVVTFGMTSSPYLAQRVVRYLVELEGSKFPLAAEIASRDIYMDDILCSLPDEQNAWDAQQQLKARFASGSFTLAKWCSNSKLVLSQIPANECSSDIVSFDSEISLKVLGLRWNPVQDKFSVQVGTMPSHCTKRTMLSAIARIFDPLGFLAPLTILAKGFIRTLWSMKLDWDEIPPDTVRKQWQNFVEELPLLSSWSIPRHSFIFPGYAAQLIGFADASQTAYGGVVYVRCQLPTGEVKISLLCAKSKIAPMKTINIPRLELCAAVLLSKLLRLVLTTFESRYKFEKIFAFSDSTTTLQWIRSSPARWQTFVANRVTQVQENIPISHWYHINGKTNPADCLSRGLSARTLLNHSLWFQGPDWLLEEEDIWPITHILSLLGTSQVPEEKSVVLIATSETTLNWPFETLLDQVSSYKKLIRITAYVLKFCNLTGNRQGLLTAADLDVAEHRWLNFIQRKHFSHIFTELERDTPQQSKKNPLILRLDLFIKDDLIRVGGRLQFSNLPYDQRHPILLPKKERFVELLVDQWHQDNLHTGPHLLFSLLQLRFWIVSGRDVVRKRVHLCNTCFRCKPKSIEPKMAPLPAVRFQQLKAFATCGIDYLGPFAITWSRHRGVKTQKAYVCLFICLSTKAVHFEVASNLSTECFLAAFRRFLSRRGPSSVICTDQGTNLVGAKRALDDMYQLLISSEFNTAISNELSHRKIEWRLNPPSSPHFGGIWEANVKCLKTHLKKIVGNHLLTYEELNTAVVQIEALLNSRPLSVLSNDPNAPTALTPAHFLTLGSPLDYLPSEDLSTVATNRLDHYQKINWIVQTFWKRWQNEYLYTLQKRSKWTQDSVPIAKGTVVVRMRENVPPLRWPLAVVEELLVGPDGIARIAKIKTRDGHLVRPLVKLCPLPTQ